MKGSNILLYLILIFSSTFLVAQSDAPQTRFSYENFNGEIPEDYQFVYVQENGESVIDISEKSTIYDFVEKYKTPLSRLNATEDNYLFWVDKFNFDKSLTTHEHAVILDFLRALRFTVFS
jgi:hypothetical protein